jgi:gas vesicle protein
MRGLMFFGLLSFLAGVLLAPKKGSELRTQMRESWDLFKYSTEEKGKEVWQAIVPAAEQVKEEGNNLKSEGKALLKDAGEYLDKAVGNGKQTLEESQVRVSESLPLLFQLSKKTYKNLVKAPLVPSTR